MKGSSLGSGVERATNSLSGMGERAFFHCATASRYLRFCCKSEATQAQVPLQPLASTHFNSTEEDHPTGAQRTEACHLACRQLWDGFRSSPLILIDAPNSPVTSEMVRSLSRWVTLSRNSSSCEASEMNPTCGKPLECVLAYVSQVVDDLLLHLSATAAFFNLPDPGTNECVCRHRFPGPSCRRAGSSESGACPQKESLHLVVSVYSDAPPSAPAARSLGSNCVQRSVTSTSVPSAPPFPEAQEQRKT